jgi:hypothetical protein
VPVIDPRHRVVNFRLSAGEYDTVYKASLDVGARSVSEFARTSVLRRIADSADEPVHLKEEMRALMEKFAALETNICEIARLIREPERQGSDLRKISETVTVLQTEIEELRERMGCD